MRLYNVEDSQVLENVESISYRCGGKMGFHIKIILRQIGKYLPYSLIVLIFTWKWGKNREIQITHLTYSGIIFLMHYFGTPDNFAWFLSPSTIIKQVKFWGLRYLKLLKAGLYRSIVWNVRLGTTSSQSGQF